MRVFGSKAVSQENNVMRELLVKHDMDVANKRGILMSPGADLTAVAKEERGAAERQRQA
jgi:hypothetical protein